ncbi:cold shock protein (beta-ribbon, CspA family) [Ligilactobacillus sp. WC1T17]|uniref:Cold shock protein (Beta-ribbon, CspA family) n=1 Tax=Ligilactobacillus ruminis TaxID=1623 RepID=A0ABY1AAT9_9LACO|nr:cold shock protein (beta-ribbon, CspA family) [Ligilactobacillus ruminis]
MLQGTVRSFDKQKGYGFITPDGSKEDLFVHYSALIEPGFKTLEAGQRVEFCEVEGKKGFQAAMVKTLNA